MGLFASKLWDETYRPKITALLVKLDSETDEEKRNAIDLEIAAVMDEFNALAANNPQ